MHAFRKESYFKNRLSGMLNMTTMAIDAQIFAGNKYML